MPLIQDEQPKIFVASVPRIIFNLQHTYKRLLKRQKIPKNVKLNKIVPQYFSSVIKLHQTIFDIETSEVKLRLKGKSRKFNYCQQNSSLLLYKNNVIGVTLVLSRKNDGLAFIYAIVVNSDWHRTWATVFLKYHSFTRLLSNGFEEVAFQAFDGNLDTLIHAKKIGAKEIVDNYDWND